MKNNIKEYEFVWRQVLKERTAFVTTLHHQKDIIELVNTFEPLDFIIESAIYLDSAVDVLFISAPSLWKNIYLEDLREILIRLIRREKEVATFQIIIFVCKYIEVDLFEVFLNIQSLQDSQIWQSLSSDRDRVQIQGKLSYSEAIFIKDSKLDLSVFKLIKAQLVNEGLKDLDEGISQLDMVLLDLERKTAKPITIFEKLRRFIVGLPKFHKL